MSERSYIDGILATHFNECSIAAADASKSAQTIFEKDQAAAVAELLPIGRLSAVSTANFKTSELLATTVEHDLVAGGRVQFSLARPEYSEDCPLSLVAIFNGDMMLPVATFQPRTDGRCSYVQIGQEIDLDDSIVVIEGATRTDQVESVRTLIKNKQKDPLINALLFAELDHYRYEIELALFAATTRAAHHYWAHTPREIKSTYIVNQDGTSELLELECAPITTVLETNDDTVNNHDIELLIGREVIQVNNQESPRKFFRRTNKATCANIRHSDVLHLVARIRGGIGLNLASFNSNTGVVTIGDFDEIVDTQTLSKLISVLSTQDDVRQNLKSLKKEYCAGIKASRQALYLDYYGKWTTNSGSSYNPNAKIPLNESDDWSKLIERFLKKSDENYRFSQSENGRLYLQAVSARPDRELSSLLSDLKISEKLNEVVDTGDSIYESVVAVVLGSLALTEQETFSYECTLKDKKVGKTITDITTRIELARKATEVSIKISGRPAALEGFALTSLFNETFALGARNEDLIDSEKVHEIAEVLSVSMTN